MHDTGRGRLQRSEDFTGTMASRPSPGLPEYTQHRTRLTGSLDESWCWSPINGLTATEAELNATCTQFYVDPVDTNHACKLRGRLHARRVAARRAIWARGRTATTCAKALRRSILLPRPGLSA